MQRMRDAGRLGSSRRSAGLVTSCCVVMLSEHLLLFKFRDMITLTPCQSMGMKGGAGAARPRQRSALR